MSLLSFIREDIFSSSKNQLKTEILIIDRILCIEDLLKNHLQIFSRRRVSNELYKRRFLFQIGSPKIFSVLQKLKMD